MKERVKKSIILVAVAIAINLALAIIKMYVGLSSNSLCIMLDATNSFFDVLTAVVTLAVFIALLFPRNEKAPFGYGRGEYLAGFVVAAASMVVGGLFFMRSLNRMAMPEPVWFGWQNCVLISVAVPIKIAIGLAYFFANKKIKSKAIKAIMIDSFLDAGVTATSLISFAVSSRVDYAVDAVFGIVMSIVIIVVAIKMIVENVRAIVCGDGASEEKAVIEKTCQNKGVKIDKIVLHDYGYGVKVGNVYVNTPEKLDDLKAEVLQKTGAEVEFIRICDEASLRDENADDKENVKDET